MATYTVKKGKHDFKPNKFPWPLFSKKVLEVEVIFDESCWWSIDDEDYPWGNDIWDWNKLIGFTSYSFSNTDNSVQYGWRPSLENGIIEVVPYINPTKSFLAQMYDSLDKSEIKEMIKNKAHLQGPPVTVKVGEPLALKLEWDTIAEFKYGENYFSHNQKRPWVIRELSAWFGGNRTAHKDMNLQII